MRTHCDAYSLRCVLIAMRTHCDAYTFVEGSSGREQRVVGLVVTKADFWAP
ncbi:MAG: hypothetical protein IPK82_18550 [Polyangiaceae bacterium]|nr:hypothetical protein [Polyangiaceae bacterium]